MKLITIDQLDMAVPMARYEVLVPYVDALNEGMARFEINTPKRIAAFIAQIAHESGDFRYAEENLNHSWRALRKTWLPRFRTDEFAQRYHRNPEKIANLIYADRFGNGDETSGDGWKYHGRGLIQVAFHDNYLAYSRAISDPSIMDDPSRLAQPHHAALSACWFWKSKGLSLLADCDTEAAFNDISYRIKGGWDGKLARLENWLDARAAIVAPSPHGRVLVRVG